MKYNVGDKVQIKSIDWYNENKDEDGDISCGDYDFVSHMTKFCGKVITIKEVYHNFYTSTDHKTDFYWTDEMIECLVEEETKYGTASNPLEPKSNANCVTRERIDVTVKETTKDISDKVVDTLMGGLMVGKSFNLPQGYQFKDEKGNVINATKIVLEKKKKEYPKTYYECRLMNSDDNKIPLKIIEEFTKLINARNAYWRIAGREMELGKSWEPDWDNLSTNHEFIKINKGCFTYSSRVLVFPTAEMRDVFYENFKELIEECKNLL